MALPKRTPGHHHAVQFYGSDEHLFATVGSFLAEGLLAGTPALVIATPAHRVAILEELARRLVDVEAARHIGDLVMLDAEEMLDTFMGPEGPNPPAFRRNVGDAIQQTLGGRVETPVRAYGEMVDLLWKQGRVDAAIRLEVLWNDLAATHSFQLLCGYAMGNFFKQAEHYDAVCRQHTHVFHDDRAITDEPRN